MADKLKMQTENIADKNFEILSKMFPNALTETITGYDDDGEPIVVRAIDADVLRQEISCKVVEGKDERYQFTWPDKKMKDISLLGRIRKRQFFWLIHQLIKHFVHAGKKVWILIIQRIYI